MKSIHWSGWSIRGSLSESWGMFISSSGINKNKLVKLSIIEFWKGILNLFKKSMKTKYKSSPSKEYQTNNRPITNNLQTNLELAAKELGHSQDIVIRHFELPLLKVRGALFFLDSLIDKEMVNKQVLESMLKIDIKQETNSDIDIVEWLVHKKLSVFKLNVVSTIEEFISQVLNGQTLLLLDHHHQAISIDTLGTETRSITDPASENEIRGSRESFVENLSTNISLIRRKIKHPHLRFIPLKVGDMTQTSVSLVYMEGIIAEGLIEEVKKRVERIQVDGVMDGNVIQEWIQDHRYSLFPQMDSTERPDRVIPMLLKGKVIILVDGSPWALILPANFWQFFTAAGDYYLNYYFSSIIRWLRISCFFFTLTIPSFYIAISTIHQEMIPTPLALSIAGARSGVPFPAIVEAFLMEIAFELLREAGIRLPKVAGQAVSIVGALIIGQAAVEAGIVSPIMVIVVSLTGISSFAIPNYNMALTARILRFPLMIVSSILGVPGLALAILVILFYMVSIGTLGVPYLTPVVPLQIKMIKDTLLRSPWTKISFSRDQNEMRQADWEVPDSDRNI